MTFTRTLLGILLLLSAGAAFPQSDQDAPAAEQLTLFESVEQSSASAGRERGRNVRRDAPSNSATSPVFTLTGVSRIGDRRTVSLTHEGGETIRMGFRGGRTAVTGYTAFSLIAASARAVQLQFPNNISCANFPESGVSCDPAANVATLSLVTADALAEPVSLSSAVEGAAPADDSEPPATINPFEALRARAGSGDVDAPAPDRFQPRRIDPADVPPGMRVVSTPFGDRLVDDN